jgi:hypothetical protein
MIHTIDEDGGILQLFWQWIDLIVDTGGVGDRKFTANYHDDYAVKQMQIFVRNQKQEIVKRATLYDVFPMSIDQMQMSWGSTDETAKLNVNYRYSRYTID